MPPPIGAKATPPRKRTAYSRPCARAPASQFEVRQFAISHATGIHKFPWRVMMLERRDCPMPQKIPSHSAHIHAHQPAAISSMSFEKIVRHHPIFHSLSTFEKHPGVRLGPPLFRAASHRIEEHRPEVFRSP